MPDRFSSLGDDVVVRLVDAAPDAMIVVDTSGKIVLANQQVEAVFGYPPAELTGASLEILIPERSRSAHVGHRTRFFAQSRPRPMGLGLDLRGRRKDGSEFPVEISLSPIDTAAGRLVCAAVRDVTERKLVEASIERVNQHLRNAVESIQAAFAIYDAKRELVLCNSSYRMLFGEALRGDVVGRKHADVLDANLSAGLFALDGESPAAFRARLIAYHEHPTGELEFRTAHGQIFRMVARPTADGGTVSTTWEITADVARENELREARLAAEQANAAKSEFLASMSHELRTPLNAILGFAQLLRRDKKTPLSERQMERIEHVIKGGEHLLRLIDDVLDLSRVESGRIPISIEPVGLPEVLQEIETTLSPIAANKHVRLVFEPVPDDMPPILADRTRLSQVLMNLGSNAIKYGRESGSAVFTTRRDGSNIVISVKDDGIGIPLDKQGRLFEPFQRAGQETGPIEGTGIGLTISRRLVELMGGKIGFASEPGEGSEFWISLPAQTESVPLPAKVAHDTASSLSPNTTAQYVIVFVEDNPANIAFMEDFLSDFENIRLITAATGEMGLELVRAHRPDVVLLDINLPGMSGLEVAERLREDPVTRSIPIVALSAAAMIRDAQRIKEAGFYRYLTKPVKVEELSNVLEEVFAAIDRGSIAVADRAAPVEPAKT